jgi:hypothetical protein
MGSGLVIWFVICVNTPFTVLGIFLCTVFPALMFWTLYGTNYRLLGDQLLIRSGPFRFRVPLAEITSVAPSRNPTSSPACSLDRLEIRYRGDRARILISPVDQAGFLEALARHCRQLVPCGGGLLREGQA